MMSFQKAIFMALVAASSVPTISLAQAEISQQTRQQFKQEFQNACGQDIATLCQGASGHKAIHQCLKSNAANLSAGCSSFLASVRQQWQQRHPANAQNGGR